MPPVHSHYENLRVARNAPPEVIRAAYKALSQRHHPDLNPNSVDAARIMSIINVAYDVLSDPAKRKLHDDWIRLQEEAQSEPTQQNESSSEPTNTGREDTESYTARPLAKNIWRERLPFEVFAIADHLKRRWGLYVAAIVILFAIAQNNSSNPQKLTPSYSSAPPVDVSEYKPQTNANPSPKFERPATAPNGRKWPAAAGHIAGYPLLNGKGYSAVTIDNTKNDADVFVKLVHITDQKAFPVRHLFIPKGESAKTGNLKPGQYDVRYQDFSTGSFVKTEAFELVEVREADGVRFSEISMTLYKVRDGNMQTQQIPESEFN
jgi:curved DNA-binding protein CbpA